MSNQHIPAAGNSTSARNYQYADVGINQHLPVGVAYVYYRLRSVDTDGTAAYSGVVVLQATNNDKATGSGIEYAMFLLSARAFGPDQ